MRTSAGRSGIGSMAVEAGGGRRAKLAAWPRRRSACLPLPALLPTPVELSDVVLDPEGEPAANVRFDHAHQPRRRPPIAARDERFAFRNQGAPRRASRSTVSSASSSAPRSVRPVAAFRWRLGPRHSVDRPVGPHAVRHGKGPMWTIPVVHRAAAGTAIARGESVDYHDVGEATARTLDAWIDGVCLRTGAPAVGATPSRRTAAGRSRASCRVPAPVRRRAADREGAPASSGPPALRSSGVATGRRGVCPRRDRR